VSTRRVRASLMPCRAINRDKPAHDILSVTLYQSQPPPLDLSSSEGFCRGECFSVSIFTVLLLSLSCNSGQGTVTHSRLAGCWTEVVYGSRSAVHKEILSFVPFTGFALSQGQLMDLQPPPDALLERLACASHMLPQVGEDLETLGHFPSSSIGNTFSCSHGRFKSSRHYHHRLPGCGQNHPRQSHPDRAARQEARRHRERIR